MDKIITIGLDIAKQVFQVHGVDAAGGLVLSRQLRRGEVLKFFAKLPGCVVGLEACASAHYWAREIVALGHEVRLMPPTRVKAYGRRGRKNDRADAAACCEAVTRPSMCFVPIKTPDQQAALMLHRARQMLIEQRTRLGNAIRAHLGELGIVARKGAGGLAALLQMLQTAARPIEPRRQQPPNPDHRPFPVARAMERDEHDRSKPRKAKPSLVIEPCARRNDREPSADFIRASGHHAAQTGRTHDRTRTDRSSQKSPCTAGAVHT